MFPVRDGGDEQETLDALERQAQPPAEVIAVAHVAGFHDAVQSGLDAGIEWFWLVDGSAVPDSQALAELLDAVGRVEGLPTPPLVVSKIVMPDGSLDPLSIPVPDLDPDLVVAAFAERLVPIRLARRGSLLVHRAGLERWGLPRYGFVFFGDDLVWTARLLRDEPGLLAPASVVVRRPRSQRAELRQRRESAAAMLRLLLSDGLKLEEKAWYGGRLVEELAGARSSS